MPEASDLYDDVSTNMSESSASPKQRRPILRFLTCGSVDDGKSTLIGRMLYDSKQLLDDQLSTLRVESRNRHVGDEGLDFSLLLDGLVAEREQGITIDVAYRYFSTDRRRFIVADTPGHEQYTRNMATGASNCDLALVLVDAKKGISKQTRRHTLLLSLLGVKHVVLVINKIDLVDYSYERYRAVVDAYRSLADHLSFSSVETIPISALRGDNVVSTNDRTAWYQGPPLLRYLEDFEIDRRVKDSPFRFPVQWVNRPDATFRGLAGTVASGSVKKGQEIVIVGSEITANVDQIVTMDGNRDDATAGDVVTITLDREVDVARGDILSDQGLTPTISTRFDADVIWFDRKPAFPGRSYIVKLATQTVPGSITDLKHTIDLDTFAQRSARSIQANEFATVTFAMDRPIAFDPYDRSKTMGSFILIDRVDNTTVGAGMVRAKTERSTNISYHSFNVTRQIRAGLMGHEPQILWFTGLSGSGKSTLANAIERRLAALGQHTYILDGDNIRHGLNRDLGFTQDARVENVRRVAEVARLMADAGLIVLVAFISPFRNERQVARDIAGDIKFREIYVSTPLETCEARDPKGLYKRARRGEIANFTGIDSPFEEPENPDFAISMVDLTPEIGAEKIIANFLQ